MKLKSAIARAASFCSPGELLHFTSHATQTAIVVQNPGFTLKLWVEDCTPDLNFSTDAKELSRQAKVMGAPEAVQAAPRARAPVVQYPIFPVEQMKVVEEWKAIQQVFHAAASPKDTARVPLQYIGFGKNGTGATDEVSVAYADVGIGSGQLIKAEHFAKWPKAGEVKAFLDQSRGWFLVGDELRIVDVEWGWFPPIPNLMAASLPHSAYFDRKSFVDALVEVVALSSTKQVRLHGTGSAPGYSLVPLNPKGPGSRFVNPMNPGVMLDVLVDGKRMITTLKSIVTEAVELQWGGPGDPIRIATDKFAEDISPLLEVA